MRMHFFSTRILRRKKDGEWYIYPKFLAHENLNNVHLSENVQKRYKTFKPRLFSVLYSTGTNNVKTWLSLCLVLVRVARHSGTSLDHPATHPTQHGLTTEKTLSARDEFFNTRSSALTTHPIKRGYKHRLVKDAEEKIRQIPRSATLEKKKKKESHRIPFVITFNPALPNIPAKSTIHLCGIY